MRISDWSSDVCSSDLLAVRAVADRHNRDLRISVSCDRRDRGERRGCDAAVPDPDCADRDLRDLVHRLCRATGLGELGGAVLLPAEDLLKWLTEHPMSEYPR